MVTATKPDLVSEEYWENLIKKSASRYFLLGMLFQKPMHGYEIAQTIEDCCEGWCKPTDGMIYPTLKELVAGGYVECTSEVVEGRQRKVCHLTDKGHEAYRSAARVWASVLPYLNESVKEAGVTVESACSCCGTP